MEMMYNYAIDINTVSSLHKIKRCICRFWRGRAAKLDNSTNESKRPLAIGKIKDVIVSMKDKLDGKIMIFVAMRPKIYSYLIDGG